MPPWADSLSVAQRWDLVAYLYTLSLDPETLAAGHALYQAECADCHGVGGRGDGPSAATLTAALSDFSAGDFMATYSNGDLYQAISAGAGDAMPAFAGALSETELRAVTHYVRSLWYLPAESTAPIAAEEANPQSNPQSPAARIFGAVINGTHGQSGPVDNDVTLRIFEHFQLVETYTTTTDAAGLYAFEAIAVQPDQNQTLIMTANYDGVRYASELLLVQSDVAEYQADIQVFETTTSRGTVQIDQLYLVLQDSATSLLVTEYLVFSNISDLTLIAESEGGPTLEVPLPAEATNLQFDDERLGARVQQSGSGFALTEPILPSAQSVQLSFSYLLPYERQLAFEQALRFPVTVTSILTPEGVALSGPGLIEAGPRQIQDLALFAYETAPLAADDSLRFEVHGRSEQRTWLLPMDTTKDLIFGGGTLALVVAGWGWWFLRRRPLPEPAAAVVLTRPQAAARRDALLRALADLDEAATVLEDSQPEYRSERQALKRELIELVTLYKLNL